MKEKEREGNSWGRDGRDRQREDGRVRCESFNDR